MNVKYSLYFDTRKPNKKGLYSIYLFFRRNNSAVYISTKLVASQQEFNGREFNEKLGRRYQMLNVNLRRLYANFENFVLSYNDAGKTNKEVKADCEVAIFGGSSVKQGSTHTLISVMDEYINDRVETNGTRVSFEGTKKKILDVGDVFLDEVTEGWLRSFEKSISHLAINTRSIQLRNIRTVVNYAIDQEYTTVYGFRKFKIKQEETRKRCLTVAQLRQLRDYPLDIDWQIEARDIFFLMFYLVGINAVDLFNLKSLTDGRCVYHRHKTGKLVDISVPEPAMKIIKKYKGKNYLLNIGDRYKDYHDYTKRLDHNLKTIGKTIKNGCAHGGEALFPDLSSYWSRHTWATIAAEIDIPIETISQAMGHSFGLRVTNIYIKYNNKKIDEAQDKVIRYLNKK